MHLRATPDVARALAMCDRLDALAVGIGSWSRAESGLRAGLPAGWLDAAEARLRRVPDLIGVGGGPEKVEAIRAALRGG